MAKQASRKLQLDETGKRLACPACREWIASGDIEVFQACPYCNQPLEMGPELEDFIIDPLVRHWQGKCINHGLIQGRQG